MISLHKNRIFFWLKVRKCGVGKQIHFRFPNYKLLVFCVINTILSTIYLQTNELKMSIVLHSSTLLF